MENSKLIKIATYYNQFDAELAKLKLEENGIYCFLKNEYVAQLQFGIANFELMVNSDDKETALKYLETDEDITREN
ncbi:MAG: putative prokaryotic signal transducing protein [Bacteroidota bacterium]|nr:putative prokaryotic signal transducing protein [Bacteroidota bacterium]